MKALVHATPPRRRPVAPAPSLPDRIAPIEPHKGEPHKGEPKAGEPAWAAMHDDELLDTRICDLGLRLEHSELRLRVAQLHDELAALGVPMQPPCYLGDEWFTPSGSAVIALPFYLAHPRLRLLERRQMREVEGGTDDECMRLLRHECGHAFDHAYRFSRRPEWQALFGRSDADATPDVYRPRPYSKSFVRHLKNHYAQAHPDEDFAETFAVILGMPEPQWRRKYRGWKALEKLEYVAALISEAARRRAPRVDEHRISDARRLKKSLRRFYADRRRAYAEDFPDFLDPDLLRLFGETSPGSDIELDEMPEPASRFLRRRRDPIVSAVVAFTGTHKYTADDLLRRLVVRCEVLGLVVRHNEARTLLELGAYLAALVTTHLHTGRYKRTV